MEALGGAVVGLALGVLFTEVKRRLRNR